MTTFTIDCYDSAKQYYCYIRSHKHDFPEAWEEMKPDVNSFMDEYGRDMDRWDMDTRSRFTSSMADNMARWYIVEEATA